MVLLPPLTPRCSGGIIGLPSGPQQQPPSSVPLQAYANYTMGSPQVGFFFTVEPPTILYIKCLLSVLVSAFYFQVPCWMPYSPLWRLSCWGLHHCKPFGVLPAAWAYVQPGDGHWSTSGMHRVAAPSIMLSRGESSCFSCQLFPSHPIYMVGHTALGAWQSVILIPLPSQHGGEGSSFPGLVPSDDMLNYESVMGIKPCDSSVVIEYQIDKFICT